MQALIYIIAGAAVAVIVGKLLTRNQKVKEEQQKRIEERKRVVGGANVTNDITGVGKGGVLKLPPFGGSVAPIETYVVTRHRYSDGDDTWYELVCQHGRRELLLEWSKDGSKIEVLAGFEDENPSMRDLGLAEADLIEFDEEEEGEFQWDGATFEYDDSGTITYYENDGRRGETYYSWDFESTDGKRMISVEKWEGERKFNVYHTWLLNADRIEVFDAGEA
jgi:hypothetical protein